MRRTWKLREKNNKRYWFVPNVKNHKELKKLKEENILPNYLINIIEYLLESKQNFTK